MQEPDLTHTSIFLCQGIKLEHIIRSCICNFLRVLAITRTFYSATTTPTAGSPSGAPEPPAAGQSQGSADETTRPGAYGRRKGSGVAVMRTEVMMVMRAVVVTAAVGSRPRHETGCSSIQSVLVGRA